MTDIDPFREFSGRDLSELFENGYGELIHDNGVVYEGPLEANNRIRRFFGLSEYFLHSRFPFYIKLSERCEKICSRLSVQNRILVTAPHDHWAVNKPIVYSLDLEHERIIVGNKELALNSQYTPVSFIMVESKILPYEWVDESFDFSAGEFGADYRIIGELFDKFFSPDIPLGLGVSFRSQISKDGESEGSVELPVEGEPALRGYSQIIGDEKFLELGNNFDNIIRVAWPLETDARLSLSPDEHRLLEDLRSVLSDISSVEERTQFISEVERKLGSI